MEARTRATFSEATTKSCEAVVAGSIISTTQLLSAIVVSDRIRGFIWDTAHGQLFVGGQGCQMKICQPLMEHLQPRFSFKMSTLTILVLILSNTGLTLWTICQKWHILCQNVAEKGTKSGNPAAEARRVNK